MPSARRLSAFEFQQNVICCEGTEKKDNQLIIEMITEQKYSLISSWIKFNTTQYEVSCQKHNIKAARRHSFRQQRSPFKHSFVISVCIQWTGCSTLVIYGLYFSDFCIFFGFVLTHDKTSVSGDFYLFFEGLVGPLHVAASLCCHCSRVSLYKLQWGRTMTLSLLELLDWAKSFAISL